MPQLFIRLLSARWGLSPVYSQHPCLHNQGTLHQHAHSCRTSLKVKCLCYRADLLRLRTNQSESGCDGALDLGAAHGAEGPRCHDVLGTALAGALQAPHIIRGNFCPAIYYTDLFVAMQPEPMFRPSGAPSNACTRQGGRGTAPQICGRQYGKWQSWVTNGAFPEV